MNIALAISIVISEAAFVRLEDFLRAAILMAFDAS